MDFHVVWYRYAFCVGVSFVLTLIAQLAYLYVPVSGPFAGHCSLVQASIASPASLKTVSFFFL